MKVWTAVLIGFLLGALSMSLFHPISKVRASDQLRFHVYEVPELGELEHMNARGSQVAGFSCIASPGRSRCFVATLE
jgi:hypothetical protein